MTRFASVILDVDSTLSGIEGIDWLAGLRGPEVAREVARLTERAMAGEIALEDVYGARLAAIAPLPQEIAALAAAYQAHVAPDAGAVLAELRANGVRLVAVSGGLREAILPLAESLGFTPPEVHAVGIQFGPGGVAEFERGSPLTRSEGKLEVVQRLALPRPSLAVGDGMTDLAMRAGVDAFAAFTGFVRRRPVAERADHVISSFRDLLSLVLEDDSR